jgi:hypothetical protein
MNMTRREIEKRHRVVVVETHQHLETTEATTKTVQELRCAAVEDSQRNVKPARVSVCSRYVHHNR